MLSASLTKPFPSFLRGVYVCVVIAVSSRPLKGLKQQPMAIHKCNTLPRPLSASKAQDSKGITSPRTVRKGSHTRNLSQGEVSDTSVKLKYVHFSELAMNNF